MMAHSLVDLLSSKTKESPMTDQPIPDPKIVRLRQVGWLRRKELDTDYIDVWEQPDGKLYAAEKGKEPVLAVLKMRNLYD